MPFPMPQFKDFSVEEFLSMSPLSTWGESIKPSTGERSFVASFPLHNRYFVEVRVPVKYDDPRSENRRLLESGTPEFVLEEIVHLKRGIYGGYDAKYGERVEFGIKEWDRLYRDRDISFLLRDPKVSAPVPLFEALAHEGKMP